jgi:hypothetical protein
VADVDVVVSVVDAVVVVMVVEPVADSLAVPVVPGPV